MLVLHPAYGMLYLMILIQDEAYDLFNISLSLSLLGTDKLLQELPNL